MRCKTKGMKRSEIVNIDILSVWYASKYVLSRRDDPQLSEYILAPPTPFAMRLLAHLMVKCSNMNSIPKKYSMVSLKP